MRKLVFMLFALVLCGGFVACEQEEINPSVTLEPLETLDPGHEGGGEEGSGVKN